ncbi:MAG: hypothetical protein ATN36_04445 [Epulopiscium sp. Nele67-Bin005]|nr:MAG: hypothetical protein ATN36_04445 [Epulopiscium sp. Nele67-Bin005]
MEKFNNLKLVRKLIIVITLLTTIILSTLVTVTAFSVAKNNYSIIMDKFTLQAEMNGTVVQSIVDNSFNVATNLQTYILNSYSKFGAPIYDEEGNAISTNKSAVYNVPLAAANFRMEDYILNTAWATISDNPDIGAIGVHFEPYAFDPTLETYSFWVTTNKAAQNSMIPLPSYDVYSTSDFYSATKATLQPVITPPAQNTNIDNQGQYSSYISYPIIYQNQFKGVVCIELITSNFDRTAISNTRYPSLHSSILSSEWTIIFDSESDENIGLNVSDFLTTKSLETWLHLSSNNEFFSLETAYPTGEKHIRYSYPITAGNEIWWSHVELTTTDFYRDVINIVSTIIIISVGAIIALICLVSMFIKYLLQPLDDIVQASAQISEGNLNVIVTSSYSDEFGILANGFTCMAAHLRSIIIEIEAILEAMAHGDFSVVDEDNFEANYNGQFAPIKISLIQIGQKLSESLENISRLATEVNFGAEDTATTATELAMGNVVQSGVVDTFLDATENIEQAVIDTRVKIEQTEQISYEAQQKSTIGATAMEEMLKSMQEISQASSTISEVLKTVEDIAEQTNLLALNATIEAARAGENGKGFNVVATEVRNLAIRSQENVREIENVIKDISQSVERGESMANSTSQSLREIVDIVEQTVHITQELMTASEVQQENIKEVINGTEELNSVIENNIATSQQSAAISQQLAFNAQSLDELLRSFKFE